MNKGLILRRLFDARYKLESGLPSLSPLSRSNILLNKIDAKFYTRQGNNITRGRYWNRDKEGKYKEFDESITLLPDEFKGQGNL